GVSVVARRKPWETTPATVVDMSGSTNGTLPWLMRSTAFWLMSTPTTFAPELANTAAVGSPMYPSPMTATEGRLLSGEGVIALLSGSSVGQRWQRTSAVSDRGPERHTTNEMLLDNHPTAK